MEATIESLAATEARIKQEAQHRANAELKAAQDELNRLADEHERAGVPLTAAPELDDAAEPTDYDISQLRVEWGMTFPQLVERLERFVVAVRAGDVVEV